MKKKVVVIIAILLVSLAIAALVAAAHGNRGSMGGGSGMWSHHEEMEEVMEGNYSDLAALRDKTGYNMMPWIDDEEAFKKMQEMHEAMEKAHKEQGYGMGGMMHGQMMKGIGRGGYHGW